MSRRSSLVFIMIIVGFTSAASGCSSGTTSAPVPRNNESVIRTSPQSLGSWSIKAQAPSERAVLAGAVVNGLLYAMGGEVGVHELVLDTVEAYDRRSNSWTTKNPLPTARTQLAAGVVGGKIYAVGGAIAPVVGCCKPVATVEVYDPAVGSWSTKHPMPTARGGLGVGVVHGILFAVGGEADATILNVVEAFDPTTESWTTKAPMPTARYGLVVSVVNGILYAIGGINNSGVMKTVEAYDPATNSWTTMAPMLTERYEMASGVINGRIYAVGGVSNNMLLNTVEACDPATNSWTAKTSMPNERFAEAAGVAGGTLYAIDGCCKGNHRRDVRTLWAFNP